MSTVLPTALAALAWLPAPLAATALRGMSPRRRLAVRLVPGADARQLLALAGASRLHPVLLVGLVIAGFCGSATGAQAQPGASRAGGDFLPDTRAAESPAQDRAALEALYHATGGPNWTDSTNWLTDAPLDEWFGVETNNRGRVTRLVLGGDAGSNNLTGAVPPELGALADLRSLELNHNQLTGAIPAELGRLANLEWLYLWDNQLTGAIPAELGRLADLVGLYLDRNQLTGAIPAELGRLADLVVLSLARNQLTGAIPPELGRLANLEWLYLWDNQLTGAIPAELGRLADLVGLYLDRNQLTGAIPAELGRLANLEDLYLSRNQLTGAIPPELGRLVKLEWLYLRATPLTGAIPRNLMHLPALTDLDIDGTGVCVPADAAFQAWVAGLPTFGSSGLTCDGLLVSFTHAWHTVVEGRTVPVTVHLSAAEAPGRSVTIPLTSSPGSGATAADYAGVPATVTFGPTDTTRTFVFEARADASLDDGETVTLGLGSPLPPGVTAGNPATATVTLVDYDRVERDRETLEALYHATGGPGWSSRSNWLSDEPLSAWAGVRTNLDGRVTRLALDRNQLRGVIPAALANLTALESLALDRNRLSGPIPPELGRLANLEGLSLFDNQLTGPIPPELGDLTRLEELALFDNELSGSIPSELRRLANLKWLYLFDNELTGPIPGELGNLANLEWLTLKSNRLTGPIPPELGNLASLETLSLWDNQLTGPIPPELGQLAGLVRLYLTSNRLSGSIPDTLGGLTNLERLDLDSNQLTGAIPPELGRLANLEGLFLDSNQLTGAIPPELGRLANLQQLVLDGNPLSGPLPRSLMQLSGLRWLDIGRTGVCVPGDAAFQAWLDTISRFTPSGFTCDVSVTVAFGTARYVVAEGESVPVTVRLSQSVAREETIVLTATPGGGATAADYAGVPSSLTFGPGDAIRTFRVEARADASPDAGETVTLGIGAPLPAGVTEGTPATATVTFVESPDGGAQDRAALEALYHATGGPNWTNSTNWLSGAPLDQWFGVETHGSGRVAVLRLGNNNLTGALLPELGALADLVVLQLGTNQLTGTIPPELGRMANLERLDLDSNQLTGAIPPELGRLANLEGLFLGSNQLTGAIPPELGRLANLEGLFLGSNQLTGTIPPELGRMANLERLDLDSNQLTGAIPPELGRLANLEGLFLGSNQLTGAIPPELGRLANLEGLFLDSNQLTGAIPPELGRLANLEWLFLAVNRLTGAIPPELGHLANLEQLSLWRNELTGAIPPELGRLANLEGLSFWRNELTGAIPPELGRLANLEGLSLSENRLTGAIPAELGNLANLEALELAFNTDVSGPLPLPLRSPLKWVDLHFTRVCVPLADPAFEAWVATATFHPSGLICGVPPPAVPAIDAAVFYTPAARRAAGGTAAIEAVIDLMIAETNQAYRDSGVHQRVILAAREEVQYTEERYNTDLDRLADPSDGHMDEVHTIRDRVGADLVHLVAAPTSVCGVAKFAPRAGSAFGLTGHQCGGDTFAHELGHNMGLRHDRFAACGDRCGNWPTPYSYGYVNQRAFSTGAPASSRWNTIMAYPIQCVAEGVSCQTLLRFSNPTQTWNGDPLGAPGDLPSDRVDGPSDTVRALNNARHVVAAFRDPPANRSPLPDAKLPDRVLDAGAVVVEVAAAFWDPDGDALTYRATSSAPTVATAVVSGSRVTVTAVSPGTATVTVTATDTDGSNTPATQAFTVRVPSPFTDHPIVPGETPIKAIHFTELRTGIDVLRREAGLPPYRWTDPVLTAGVTRVRLVHLLELRAALAAAYVAAGRSAPGWTDAAPVGGATAIRAAHLMELRAAVRALQ